MKSREELQAERRQLEDAYRNAYQALDEHFVLYGDVDSGELAGVYQPLDPATLDESVATWDDAGFALPEDFPDDGAQDSHEGLVDG